VVLSDITASWMIYVKEFFANCGNIPVANYKMAVYALNLKWTGLVKMAITIQLRLS
jgi:hypothetical protein